jgi:hypothetical protein
MAASRWCMPTSRFPSLRLTIFRTSAARAGTASSQFLALKRQGTGLSRILAAPVFMA